MKNIFYISLILLAVPITPMSFAWDGSIAMDADKRNVGRGQIITYEGHIYGDYPIDDELVFITVLEKDTKKIILTAQATPESKPAKYFENTAWPFTFQVETSYQEFSAGKTYVVEAMYGAQSAKLEFFIQHEGQPTCLEKLGNDDIAVFTDKENYEEGDTIRISGCLSDRAFAKTINVAVYDPEGKKIGVSSIMPRSDRTYSDNFVIDEKFGLDGTYSVEVDAGGLYSSSKSFVVPEFGGIAMIVMLAGIASVVAVSSKYARIVPRL